MNKWLIPLLLALAVVCAVLFHIVLPLHNGIQINTVDAYYFLRYADIWPNYPQTDYFFNYPQGGASTTEPFPAVITITAKLLRVDITTAGAVLPPILFLLTLVPVYIITKTLFKSNLIAAISVFLLAIMPGEILYRTMLGATDRHCLEIFLFTTTMMFGILAVSNLKSKWSIIYGCLGITFSAFYLASWAGAPLTYFIMGIFLLALFCNKWQAWAMAIFGCIGIYHFLPSLAGSICILIPNTTATVSETTPLFFTNGQFDISAMLAYFSVTFFITLFGLGVLIHQYVKNKSKELLLFMVWTVVMLALTFSMKRFAYYSAINIAVLTAFSSVYIINIFKSSRKRVLELTAALLLICLVFGYRSAITATSNYGVMPVEWRECCAWLRNEVQDADSCYLSGNDPGYGVLSHWNYGYWIVEAGHMPVYGTPGNWRGNDTLCKADITEDITRNKWKYIILDKEMFTTNVYSIFYANHVKPEDTAVYNLYYFGKPVWQSENGNIKVFGGKHDN